MTEDSFGPEAPVQRDAEEAGDAELLAAHDPEGLEVAIRIAQEYQHLGRASSDAGLPPPRGVTPKPRKRRPAPGETRSGSHPDERDPRQVGDALGRLINEKGWGTEVNLHLMLTRWPELVGQTNAEHSHPETFRDKVLVVRAESSTWASALRLIAPRLVAQLNERLGQGSVLRISVLGPASPSWKHGPRSVRDGRGPRDTYG